MGGFKNRITRDAGQSMRPAPPGDAWGITAAHTLQSLQSLATLRHGPRKGPALRQSIMHIVSGGFDHAAIP